MASKQLQRNIHSTLTCAYLQHVVWVATKQQHPSDLTSEDVVAVLKNQVTALQDQITKLKTKQPQMVPSGERVVQELKKHVSDILDTGS